MAREFFEPARKELSHDEVRITSENFLWSTLPNSLTPRTEAGFADRLDLPHLAPTIERLYDFARNPGSQSQSDLLTYEVDTSNQAVVFQRRINSEGSSPGDDGEVAEVPDGDDSEIEYGITQYFEPNEGLVPRDSALITGKKREITLNVFPLIRQGKVPSVPMHTHPNKEIDNFTKKKMDIPESDWDLALFMRQGAWSGNPNLRPVNWIAILCENKQLLIGVTANTPKPMSAEGVKGYLEEWGNAFKAEDRDQIEAAKTHAQLLLLEGINGKPVWEQQLAARLDRLGQFEQRLREGSLSPAELAFCQSELDQIDVLESVGYHPELLPDYLAAKDGMKSIEQAAFDRVHGRLRKYMNVVVFEGTNGSRFDKVAA